MAVKIRLRRTGKKNAACFRVIVADGRSPRDGKFLEIVGFYDPRQSKETLKMDRIDYWLGVGAQPSNTVASIIDRAKTGRTLDPNRVKVRKKYQTEEAESKES